MSVCVEGVRPPIVQDGCVRTLYVTYLGDVRVVDGCIQETFSLVEAFQQQLQGGDVLQFLDNKYWPPLNSHGAGTQADAMPIRLSGLKATPDNPITIRGLGSRTLLCGTNAAVPLYPDLPRQDDYAFFQILDCEGIVIEDFVVDSCWPCFVYMEGSHYVAVRSITAIDSLYFVFARGEGCRNILVEGCDWTQDPSGAVWTQITWEHTHHVSYRYLNGALLGADGIAGGVVFRNNSVRYAYNALRLRARDEAADGRLNVDVEVYGNAYDRVRDNVVEPEGTATNLWIHHNSICNAHAWLSFDGVGGGYWAVFANRGWFTEKPGTVIDDNTGGRVLKFDPEPPYPTGPFESFNNSWYLRIDEIKAGSTRNLIHRNNAVQFCAECDHAPGVCNPDRALVGSKFMADGWDRSVRFDYDLNNRAFPSVLTKNGQETHGTYDPDFRFVDGASGDFRIAKPVAGEYVSLESWGVPDGWQPERFEAGQLQGTEQMPLEGPAFVARSGYDEPPRIVRAQRREAGEGAGRITLFFDRSLETADYPVILRLASGEELRAIGTADAFTLAVDTPVPPAGVELVLPENVTGTNGETITLWAAPPNAGVTVEPVEALEPA